eukprot:SAG31_NODE_2565_length_5468_cov_8.226672_2_plen_35_part_00
MPAAVQAKWEDIRTCIPGVYAKKIKGFEGLEADD